MAGDRLTVGELAAAVVAQDEEVAHGSDSSLAISILSFLMANVVKERTSSSDISPRFSQLCLLYQPPENSSTILADSQQYLFND